MTDINLDNNQRYIINNFHKQKPFSSFLPGIAGPLGIPLWVFYVNRGQAIASFGVENKNNPIVEFQPANKTYQSVSYLGFRTFLKLHSDTYYEPFGDFYANTQRNTQMGIGLNDFEIRETNNDIGLETRVNYFILPSENFAALVRKISIKNISSKILEGEVIDGLPAIVPFGVPDNLMKNMSNTAMAWMGVENLKKNVPFYRITSSIEDKPEVEEYEAGHFYLCFSESNSESKILKPIVDPTVLFGANTALTYPEHFLENSLKKINQQKQINVCRTPCGFFGTDFSLNQSEEISIYALVGHIDDIYKINIRVDSLAQSSYINEKHKESIALAEKITGSVTTKTSSPLFNAYNKQNFLDNILRGGFPVKFTSGEKSKVYYLYSRKHGDIERDYNFFSLTAEYYSQGNGNYRDVNQNRRCDIFIEPAVSDSTIKLFMNLIQTDGYNPLVYKGVIFNLKEEYYDQILNFVEEKNELKEFLKNPFTPGKILKFIENHHIKFKVSREQFITELIIRSDLLHQSEFGEGFWIDHWTYNLDLIENYLTIYPDKKEALLFEKEDYTFYDNAAAVLPRTEKYILANGKVLQSGSVAIDQMKQKMLASRSHDPDVMRHNKGEGEIYKTNLFEKLICLTANKFSTLDPLGMGIEMEANKPGWYDALNGLPALFASSLSETYELKRLLKLLLNSIEEFSNRQIYLTEEIWNFFVAIEKELNSFNKIENNFEYWDNVSVLRERYREDTKFGFSGELIKIKITDLRSPLEKFKLKVIQGIEKGKKLNGGMPPTYFIFEPVKWTPIMDSNRKEKRNKNGHLNVSVQKFKVKPLPLFLEGVVKEMKSIDSRKEAINFYKQVKASNLFDEKLRMYKVNESLQDQSIHIGRARAFTPGWLENESVFLHMHYKYLLALLKAELFETFWNEAKDTLIPFLDPNIYGRSILENSSFLVSSAHPDSSLHGKGFVARLSGSTAEFINMWFLMMAGNKPFVKTDSGLVLQFSPSLPGWLFKKDGTVSFTFLGKIKVTYFNAPKCNITPGNGIRIKYANIKTRDKKIENIKGNAIPEPWVSKIRDGEISEIDVYF